MPDIPIKVKTRIIVDFVKGMRTEDISFNERIPMNSVLDTIKEWENGFLDVNIGNDIPEEIKDIARMMNDRSLTVQDILEGYSYYEIFRDREKEKVIRIIDEIYGMSETERKKFIETANRMISYRKYDNIEYTEIPKALEDMVYKGKELKREIKSMEMHIADLKKQWEEMNEELFKLRNEKEMLSKEIDIANYIKEKVGNDINAIKNTVDALQHSGFDYEMLKVLSDDIVSIKRRGFTVDQFLKVFRYFEELMNIGLTVQMMEDLLERLKESGMDIEDYLNERYAYVRDKNAYMKSVKELVDVHKKLEKDIKLIEEEIQRKKNKLEKM